jgi:hypothetical protein
MKTYVKIENNMIVKSIVVDENSIPEFLNNDYWVLLNENNFGIGDLYDPNFKKFYHQKPFDSWVLNTTTFEWEPPIPNPTKTNGKQYVWNEEVQKWLYTGISIDITTIPPTITKE